MTRLLTYWNIKVQAFDGTWKNYEAGQDISLLAALVPLMRKAVDQKDIAKAMISKYTSSGGYQVDIYPEPPPRSKDQRRTAHSHFSPRGVKHRNFRVLGVKVR